MKNTKFQLLTTNTIALYVRQILVLSLNLVSIRMLLSILGVEDYGIYSIIGSLVLAFGFLSSSMAVVTQRYLSHAIGSDNNLDINVVFNSCFQVYILIAFLLFILAESVGIWSLSNFLVIPNQRYDASVILFQLIVCTFIVSTLTTPFSAILIANEGITTYAFLTVIEASLKLFAVYFLYLISWDHLISYGVCLCIIACIMLIITRLICWKSYPQFKLKFTLNRGIFTDVLAFSSWTLIGNIANILKVQGTSIMLNAYFGIIVSASSAIATQINYAVLILTNLNVAFRSNNKHNASNNRHEVVDLTFLSTKISFF